MCNEHYIKEQYKRVIKLYDKSKHFNFFNRKGLADWYISELKINDCKCYYCETSIHNINKLITANKLKTRAVRGDGKRGPVLEIDKNDDVYSKETCVLACYYCNNDKSYTMNQNDYKEHFGKNRKKYFEILMEQVK